MYTHGWNFMLVGEITIFINCQIDAQCNQSAVRMCHGIQSHLSSHRFPVNVAALNQRV